MSSNLWHFEHWRFTKAMEREVHGIFLFALPGALLFPPLITRSLLARVTGLSRGSETQCLEAVQLVSQNLPQMKFAEMKAVTRHKTPREGPKLPGGYQKQQECGHQ